MKKVFLLLAFFVISSFAKADTTYINYPELAPMLIKYINISYDYGTIDIDQSSEFSSDIDKWMTTKEGNKLAQTDVDWQRKYDSFFKMFPNQRSNKDKVCKALKDAVILNIKLFVYTIDASIELVDGKFNGIIFFDNSINDQNRWHKTIKDPVFNNMYENLKDDDGISWYYKINKKISKRSK